MSEIKLDIIQSFNKLGCKCSNNGYHLYDIQKWLREVHSLDISIIVNYNQANQVKSYRSGIIFINKSVISYMLIDSFFIRPKDEKYKFIEFNTYEEALEASIWECYFILNN